MYTHSQTRHVSGITVIIFQNRVVLTMSVHDDGYSRNVSYLTISVHDDGYSRNVTCIVKTRHVSGIIVTMYAHSQHDTVLE
jgi:hypothetical protein